MSIHSTEPDVQHVWSVYLRASEEARRRGDRRTGTEHLLLALLEDPSIEALVGVDLDQAREVLDSLDHQALAALGLDSRVDAPALPTHPVTKEPRLRDVIKEDRLRMSPEAKKVLERAVKPNRRKTQVTASQVLAQILNLGSTDPAAALLGALGVDVAELASALNVVASDD